MGAVVGGCDGYPVGAGVGGEVGDPSQAPIHCIFTASRITEYTQSSVTPLFCNTSSIPSAPVDHIYSI